MKTFGAIKDIINQSEEIGQALRRYREHLDMEPKLTKTEEQAIRKLLKDVTELNDLSKKLLKWKRTQRHKKLEFKHKSLKKKK